mmetsp:Transcript_19202/g.41516  ORF Transcript_19202/g.41516 Transcript_19202/m.41516 type:complete len:399 (-) Transcript_19202:682-1878(-)
MVGVAGAKPVAIGECWDLPPASRLEDERLWTFFMSWSELTFKWPNTDATIRMLYNSDEVITLDTMPGWVNRTSFPSSKPTEVETSNRESSSFNSWSVDYSNDGIIVDLGKEHTINRIRLRWEDILNDAEGRRMTTDDSENVASVSVDDGNGSVRMEGKSDSSLWQLELSRTGTDNAIPSEDTEPDDVPAISEPTKAPTKSFFETSSTESPTSAGKETYSYVSDHGTYLCAYNGGVGLQETTEVELKYWDKIPVGNEGKVALRSAYGTYLGAWWDGSVKMATHIKAWETWAEIKNEDGTVAFLSHHGNYLSAWPDGIVRLSGQNIGWERLKRQAGLCSFSSSPSFNFLFLHQLLVNVLSIHLLLNRHGLHKLINQSIERTHSRAIRKCVHEALTILARL